MTDKSTIPDEMLDDILRDAVAADAYWDTDQVLRLGIDLEAAFRDTGLTEAEWGRTANVSPSQTRKALDDPDTMTLATLIALAHGAGQAVDIRLMPRENARAQMRREKGVEALPPVPRAHDTVCGHTQERAPVDLYDLRRLRDATNEAVAESAGQVDGAINWADLACRDVRRWTDDTGASGYAVSIEEASPDAWELQTFVRGYLVEAGFANVEVVTEW